MKRGIFKRISIFCFSIVKLISPQTGARITYRYILGRKLHLNNPKDLNEKINYLKFHSDLQVWADLSDKYKVRAYVESRGLKDILVPIYGMYKTSEDLVKDWKNLPESFIIKSNNGCGTVRLVINKDIEDLKKIKSEMDEWLTTKRIGFGTIEPHYSLIKPCIIVEELLNNESVKLYSKSLVDYKVWCFNGKPFSILVVFDRDIKAHSIKLDAFDLNWNHIENVICRNHTDYRVPKPVNLEEMINNAAILSKDHKQVRVDMYNINGKIYFGEMTFTSQGGYMDYYTPEYLKIMGDLFDIE
jgi:hypothetical protein